MQNYHRHSSFSNLFTSADSSVLNEDYAKRAVELGHGIISSVEHGWQGYYHQTFELAKKYNLKCVIGTEAYWVKDRLEKDKSNNHIVILAKSNQGREAINDILSEASLTGYYYRPRVDIPLLLTLPPKDVLVTSACIAFNGYEDIDDIILQLYEHFEENFMLEVQYHNTDKQKAWNKHLLELSGKHGVELIAGLDSHYIIPEEAAERDYLLEAKGISYPDEEGWYMDYPDNDEITKRFLTQGILNPAQIKSAMENTDVCLDFCDYDKIRIFMKDIKLPTLFPWESQEQKNKRYSKLITRKFREYTKGFPKEEYDKYLEGVGMEVQTYKDTGMVDYPLIDYEIVKEAKTLGGLITDTGRGSAVGYFTNTLCGFSSVDRFKSDIKLYPERFISTTRILETKSLPDIDMNVGNVEIFEEAQKKVLGENHAYPMIAFGTLKKKSAFKIYAKARGLNFDLANEISGQIGKFEEAVKNAEEDDKDSIDLYDYVDKQYEEYIEESKKYWGIISDRKKAPSAYLLYDGDIRKEVGLIKCKSESTGKECVTCVIDGAIAENYKFLKNDLLKVDVVLLIDKVFKRIGIKHFGVNELLEKVKGDSKVWNLYANGYTIGLNQVEQDGSRHKCMNYKPHNVSELSAFVAAIRPGFKSMYSRFEKREDFSWGIPSLDNLLRTEELPVSFLFFQEQVMSVLNYAGFPMDVCYGAIKSIAKKHPEKVKPLKEQFIPGFKERLIKEDNLSEDIAEKTAEDVWNIVNDNCGYGFNSAHAYCMACDSLYQAWQKAHYPYEFYEVLLNHYSEKGNKDKVLKLKQEMTKAFGIKEGEYNFRNDHRAFVADKNKKAIHPSLSAIKGVSKTIAEELYKIHDKEFASFIDVLVAIKSLKINSKQLDIFIRLNMFSEFGEINELLQQRDVFDELYDRKEIKFEKWKYDPNILRVCAEKCIEKTAKGFDSVTLIECVLASLEPPETTPFDRVKYEKEFLGYISTTIPDIVDDCYYVTGTTGYNNKTLILYNLKTGETLTIKNRTKKQKAPKEDDVIRITEMENTKKYKPLGKDENGKMQFERIDEYETVLTGFSFVNVGGKNG